MHLENKHTQQSDCIIYQHLTQLQVHILLCMDVLVNSSPSLSPPKLFPQQQATSSVSLYRGTKPQGRKQGSANNILQQTAWQKC